VKTRYFVKPKADRDLDECADYLASQASLDVALRFVEAAHATFEAIASQPGLGRAGAAVSAVQTPRPFSLPG
jgi:plasmid stabilization system protein ParE